MKTLLQLAPISAQTDTDPGPDWRTRAACIGHDPEIFFPHPTDHDGEDAATPTAPPVDLPGIDIASGWPARRVGGATRLPSWTCPLCGRRTAREDALRHGVAAHPATLPTRMTVADRLRLIPALAREAALTLGAPNPSAQTDRTKRVVQAHPPLPIDAAALDALAPDDGREIESWVPISRLVECSRLVWEAFGLDERRQHPQPVGEPAFTSECAWLANAWPTAQTVLDPSAIDWIDTETRDVCAQLASVARMSRETRYRCPDCGESLHLGESGWMVCKSGTHMHPGPDRLVRKWRRRPPMTTNHLAAELRILPSRIRKWHERGKLVKAREEGRTAFWLPWDVVRCLYPDVVAAIEAGEDTREVASRPA